LAWQIFLAAIHILTQADFFPFCHFLFSQPEILTATQVFENHYKKSQFTNNYLYLQYTLKYFWQSEEVQIRHFFVIFKLYDGRNYERMKASYIICNLYLRRYVTI